MMKGYSTVKETLEINEFPVIFQDNSFQLLPTPVTPNSHFKDGVHDNIFPDKKKINLLLS